MIDAKRVKNIRTCGVHHNTGLKVHEADNSLCCSVPPHLDSLVHASLMAQEIDFLCNCCSCRSRILKTALRQPKPGRAFYSGFHPRVNPDLCTSCGACARADRIPQFGMDRCFGCGVCAVGCPAEAMVLGEKPGLAGVPKDRKALREALEVRK